MHTPWSRDICPICVSLVSTFVLTVLCLNFFAGTYVLRMTTNTPPVWCGILLGGCPPAPTGGTLGAMVPPLYVYSEKPSAMSSVFNC